MKRYVKANSSVYPTITVYDAETGEEIDVYTPDMEPEIFPGDGDTVVDGPFTIYYLSGYEVEDDDFSECFYGADCYAVVSNDVKE